jgi:DNA-binding MarR family transcriptional regulator
MPRKLDKEMRRTVLVSVTEAASNLTRQVSCYDDDDDVILVTLSEI